MTKKWVGCMIDEKEYYECRTCTYIKGGPFCTKARKEEGLKKRFEEGGGDEDET